MKIYNVPEAVAYHPVDTFNYDHVDRQENIERHKASLKKFLKKYGYTGEHTGKIVRFSVADGYAEYMIADTGRKFALVHLPYGDAYHYYGVENMTKKSIIAYIKQ